MVFLEGQGHRGDQGLGSCAVVRVVLHRFRDGSFIVRPQGGGGAENCKPLDFRGIIFF